MFKGISSVQSQDWKELENFALLNQIKITQFINDSKKKNLSQGIPL